MGQEARSDGVAETVLVRVPKDIRDRVLIVANRERRTIGAQIQVLLEEPLAQAEAQGSGADPRG